jgi:protein involved in polysaccharide export with SLBB domain
MVKRIFVAFLCIAVMTNGSVLLDLKYSFAKEPEAREPEAPAQQAAIPTRIIDRTITNVKIIPEDVLIIQYEDSRDVIPVDKNGMATIPGIGDVKVSGRTAYELSEFIRERTAINNVVIIATLPQGVESYTIPKGVAVIGEVNRPGIVAPGRLTDIVAQSMGTTPSFNGKVVIFRRNEQLVIKYDKILKGKYQYNLMCKDGDTVSFGKSTGGKFIDSTRPWLGIMRDIALVIIAVVEVNDLGERHGWW